MKKLFETTVYLCGVFVLWMEDSRERKDFVNPLPVIETGVARGVLAAVYRPSPATSL